MKNNLLIVFLLLISFSSIAQSSINAEEAINYIGKTVTVCGKVDGARYLENSLTKPTLINVGGDFPNHALVILIRDEDRKNFGFKPEEAYINKEVCVTGELVEYKGKPEIVVSMPSEIQIKDQVSIVEKRQVSAPTFSDTTALVRTKAPIVEKPKAKSAEPAVKPEASSYIIEVTSNVNLREGPSEDLKVLTIVKSGTSVNIYKSANGWSYVSIKNGKGEDAEAVFGYIKNSVLK